MSASEVHEENLGSPTELLFPARGGQIFCYASMLRRVFPDHLITDLFIPPTSAPHLPSPRHALENSTASRATQGHERAHSRPSTLSLRMAPAGRAAEVPAELGGESSLVSRPSWLPNKGSTPSAPRGRGQEKDGKLRKSCNCKNSRCLKLYCECFASGQYCFACNCQGCHNNPENDEKRKQAIDATLER